MNLKEIISSLSLESNVADDVHVKGISHDSRSVQEGELFVALSGGTTSGELYAKDAIARGAVAVVAERYIDDLPCIVVDNTRRAYAQIAQLLTDNAAKKLKIIGVVGTNGKTTTASLISDVLRSLGHRVLTIGTLGSKLDDVDLPTNLTTPDPSQLHQVIQYAVDRGCEYCVMEVSAHAIFYDKVYGISFDAAVFTNLSQDHLDFFGDMDSYAHCKARFFYNYPIGIAIVNGDDKLGRALIDNAKAPTISYGIDCPCDAFAIDISTADGISYTANVCDRVGIVGSKLHGKFNVYNTLAALTTVVALGCDLTSAIDALSTIPPISGRYNVINSTKKVIIDYAHTPDGLANILTAVRDDSKGKVISVFGCGGNRDPSKRSIMGSISGRLSDMTIVTTDNSRLEDPYVIMDEIAAGVVSAGGAYQIIRNREDAIAFALMCAGLDDVVVIAGKGAEEYMDEGGEKKPYSDYITVKKLLRRGDF